MIESLRTSAEAMLASAMDGGADEAAVTAQRERVTHIHYEKNDFSISTTNERQSFGVTVHADRRKGRAATNERGEAALAETARRALTLAKPSVPDEHLCLPGPQAPRTLPGRWDPRLAELAAAPLHELAAAFTAAAREDARITLDGATLTARAAEEVLVNSRGLSVSDRATRLSWSLMGMAKTADEVTSFDYDAGGAWSWEEAAGRPEDAARRLAAKLTACLGARKGESYRGCVLLSPAAASELILEVLEFHVSGRQIMDGKSRWGDSLGEAVAAANLTVTDDPFDMSLGGATPHDGEGVATRPLVLIEDGVLKAHIDSIYTAKRRGTASTGHEGGLHGPVIAPGEHPREVLLAEADKLVVVERYSGNADPVTGDFSGVAKGSHWVERGERVHPLAETMIAGNVFEMLKSVVALSDASEPVFAAYRAPWILVDGISVTAG